MMLTKNEGLRLAKVWLRLGIGLGVCLAVLAWNLIAVAQAVSTTTIQGTVSLANGQPGAGTLDVSWPSFTTAANQAVAAGRTTATIAPDGFLSVKLAANLGATPAGLYYTAVYHMSDGTTSTEYWVVPQAAQITLGQVRATVMPAAQAVQAVNKAYVDQSISALQQTVLNATGGSLSGPLYLSGDPVQALQAADKHYVDSAVGLAVPLAGGTMTGALTTPAMNGIQSPLAGSSQTTLQAAVNSAGTSGAVQIPPAYAGTDGFSNPNGVYVADLRSNGAQQYERSVKEFGAVCDGATDDTIALQSAINYAQVHGVSLTIPQGTCKTRTLVWHGESIGGMGKQVSALMGFPGQDVLATVADSANLLGQTRLHDLTIYVDQSMDVSCSPARGRIPAGSCALSRLMEINSILSPGGSGLAGTNGVGAAWAVGNCAIAMPAATGAGGNGLRLAEIENLEIAATGTDPMSAQYGGAHSTHSCGMYLAQWPQWSEFRNIDIRGLNTGIAIPALPGAVPAGLNADSNRWQNLTIQATHGFTAAAGSNDVLDGVVLLAANSAATSEPPTGLVLDFASLEQGWTVRNAVVLPSWIAVPPQLAVAAQGGAVSSVTIGAEHGLGFDPYGVQIPVKFSGSCTAQATANVNADGSISSISVSQSGAGCSGTTTASLNAAGTWDTAAPVNLIAGQNMSFFGGNLLKGNGGYTVWNATGSQSYGTQFGGGGTLPGGGSYKAQVVNGGLGATNAADQFPGADFGAKLQACVNSVSAAYGGTCDARNFTGSLTMSSSLAIATANTTVLLPCATVSTAFPVVVTAGTRNVALRGCALRGTSAASGSQGGTVFLYSGAGAMVQVGDATYAADTPGFHMDNVAINTTASSSASAKAIAAFRTQEMDMESLYLLGNANQTGITLDGTGNYTGGTFLDVALTGFQTAVNAIGHQAQNSATTDWVNASAFIRLHINCPTSNGSPMAGTYGINLLQGDGNTFTGGDVEGCATALHLGPNAQNNTIVGLRNENSTSQVVADAGSSYNNWMTGGTMFTGQLTDNGTRNSFLDTFHRSFNGISGDWYGSQQDATLTNHYRIGIGAGNERGLLNRYQTDSGYRWTTGLSDATAGEQFYQVLDELNNVYRLSIGQYNNGQSSTNNQTVVNAAGTGAVVLNGSNNAGTGGVVFGSGGTNETTVATISNAGNAQFNGTLQVGGASTFSATPTVKNQANAEIDSILWAGLTTSQKESFIYKDWNGNSQWYMVKDASNNWALNSATGGLDSFKAYQSSNSGDTYINASNATGVVRVNYETGSGSAFNIYGGNSSTLYASFTGANSIKLPGLAASSGHYCVQVDNSGYITNTGSPCGTGAGGSTGTINAGTTGQIAYYTTNGNAIAGASTVSVSAGGTGATTTAGALANLGIGVLSVKNCGAVGDGVTDDTAALNSCFATILTTHQTLYLPTPANCYKVSSSLLWGGFYGTVRIKGDGQAMPNDGKASPICYTTALGSTVPVIDSVNNGFLTINGISVVPLNGTPSAGTCIYSAPATTGGGVVTIQNSYLSCGGGAGGSAAAIIGMDLSSVQSSSLYSLGNALVMGNDRGPSTTVSHYATGAGYGDTHLVISGSILLSTLSPAELTGNCGDWVIDNAGGGGYIAEVNGGDPTHGIIDFSYASVCPGELLTLNGVNIENQSRSTPFATIATMNSTTSASSSPAYIIGGQWTGRLMGGAVLLAGLFNGVQANIATPDPTTLFGDDTTLSDGVINDTLPVVKLSPTAGGSPGFSGTISGSTLIGASWDPFAVVRQPTNPLNAAFTICSSSNAGSGGCFTNSGASRAGLNILGRAYLAGEIDNANGVLFPLTALPYQQVNSGLHPVLAPSIPGAGAELMTGPATSNAGNYALFTDAVGTLADSGIAVGNATSVNGAAVAANKTLIGTNALGQIVDASSTTLSNNTSGTAAGLSAQLPISGVGTIGLSGTSPINVSATGVISCATCNTSSASVSSVGLSIPGSVLYTVSNSPITGSGTLTLTPNTQTAATVFAGPATGPAATPSFRSLAATDLPALITSSTSGTAANLSGIPALPNGTTATTQSAGDNSTKLATTAYVQNTSMNPFVPGWLQYLGDGSDGANTNASGGMSGDKYYTTFTVPYGNTVTVGGGYTGLVIHATGTCTIAGTINFRASYNFSSGYGGGSSGGSGGGTSAGTAGNSPGMTPNGLGNVSGGTAGAVSGGNGGNGLTPTSSQLRPFINTGAGNEGMNIYGAPGRQGANSGGTGGSGGTAVTLICGSIVGTDGTHTGIIDVSGGAGNPPVGNSTGAGSGAGGGAILLSSQQAVTTWPILYTAGGPGGVGYNAAGTVPQALGVSGSCTSPAKAVLGVSGGALNSCTVVQAGAGCGTGTNVTFSILGGGGSGGTVTPTWSGGALASCTATGGSGYTAATYTTAGSGGDGGAGWSAQFQNW